ncbi:MAG: hypothetical protein ISQ34_04300 [Rickettsiales bacterium]|nr:hypothetical protein [Rickettsiales bacterium]
MDLQTKKILDRFTFHLRIKKFLTFFCYLSIIFGVCIYGFYATKQSKTVKIVTDYKKNKKNYQTEKIMTNPRINYQYNDHQVYNIKAKKAFHKNNSEAQFYDVDAVGDIGKITAGKLNIDEKGNRLVFTDNPVLILNNTRK